MWVASIHQTINSNEIENRTDFKIGYARTEVRAKTGDSHLGHVFNDGPPSKGGMRYCINSASLRFIPKEKLTEEGYGNLPASLRPPKVSKLCAKTENIQSIGDEIAILWTGGKETFYKMEMLRAESPSAENKGESDLLGNRIGGTTETSFSGIRVTDGKWLGICDTIPV